MRLDTPALSLLLGCLLASCGEQAAAGPRPDDLVLEVGGRYPSLRQALVAAGRAEAGVTVPETGPESGPGRADTDMGADPAARGVDAGGEAAPPPEVAPAPADHIVVRLARGETLIHLAKRHLGDGNRFREILTANGWTDRDARRLREGQEVRIPLGRGAASGR